MMILKEIQSTLDNVFLPCGITSYHKRKKKIDIVATNQKLIDAYIVYKIISDTNKIYGDGKPKLNKINIDFNLYYQPETPVEEITKYIELLENTLILKDFRKVAARELPDADEVYAGYNIEFSLVRVL